MITRPDTPVKLDQLNREVAALGLPGFRGCARLSRDLDTREAVPPFILFKFDDPDVLTTRQITDLDAVLAAHVPDFSPTPREVRKEELLVKLKDDSMTLPEVRELLRLERGL